MAEGIQFVCTGCNYSIEAWSDGNPFYLDENGKKTYAYHPHHAELEKCIANDSPHLCLKCGKEVVIDSRLDSKSCTDCGATDVVGTFCLDGVKCPKCHDGHFQRDPGFYRIS